MSENGDKTNVFWKAAEPILRKFMENIESPYVWTPLGLFVLSILAFTVSRFQPFLWVSLAFLILAFIADWIGRWRNVKTPPRPEPAGSKYKDEIFRYRAEVQAKAVDMMEKGKIGAARRLINENLKAVEEALESFPDDSDFHALMGYTCKDVYQSSRGLLPDQVRKDYLSRARTSFETALNLNPGNASALNGMGNVLFFEGRFDDALRYYDDALLIAGPAYTAAEHDKLLALRVKAGELPFDY